jgi:hypothetical protein
LIFSVASPSDQQISKEKRIERIGYERSVKSLAQQNKTDPEVLELPAFEFTI